MFLTLPPSTIQNVTQEGHSKKKKKKEKKSLPISARYATPKLIYEISFFQPTSESLIFYDTKKEIQNSGKL